MVVAKAKGLGARGADLGELLGVLSRLMLERLSSCDRKQLWNATRRDGAVASTRYLFTGKGRVRNATRFFFFTLAYMFSWLLPLRRYGTAATGNY